MIDLEKIKVLREQTEVSLAECRRALAAAGGEVEKALALLRRPGARVTEKKVGRELKAGWIGVYLHSNGAIGALVEVGCETDFVARNSEFKKLADDLAMQVAAFAPQTIEELLTQPFLKDETLKVSEVLQAAVQKFGEKIEVKRLSRLQVEPHQ